MFEQFGSICISITSELQQKIPVMTPVRHVKNSSIASQSSCPCHGFTPYWRLSAPYSSKKWPKNASKAPKRTINQNNPFRARDLLWSEEIPGQRRFHRFHQNYSPPGSVHLP